MDGGLKILNYLNSGHVLKGKRRQEDMDREIMEIDRGR